VKRREFITLIIGAAACPIAARGQEQMIPVIGFVGAGSLEGYRPLVDGFRRGLTEAGYFEDRNVAIEYRWAAGHYDEIPGLVDDLIHRHVSVIFTAGAANAPLAAKAATPTIPIVFAMGDDPVRRGLVGSMSRPGANVTGVTFINEELLQKRVELLHELVRQSTFIALLVNPNNDSLETTINDAREGARAVGRQIEVFLAGDEQEVDAAFSKMIQMRADALLIGPDPFFNSRSRQLGAQATNSGLPALYSIRDFTAGGGLLSFGPNQAEAYRQAAGYVARILRGERPADLPVIQPTTFEFTINLRAAKTLGIVFPQSYHLRADEVID
jgi:putative ABC transport system substrate-binding protein